MMNKASRKYYFMAAGLTLMLILEIFYWGQTRKVMRNYNNNQAKIDRASNASLRLPELRKQIEEIHSQLGRISAGSQPEAATTDFLIYLTKNCESLDIRLNNLPETEEKTEGKLNFLNTTFCLEGSFANILQFIYRIEEQDHAGIISFLKMESKEIRTQNGKRELLFATLQLKRFVDKK